MPLFGTNCYICDGSWLELGKTFTLTQLHTLSAADERGYERQQRFCHMSGEPSRMLPDLMDKLKDYIADEHCP